MIKLLVLILFLLCPFYAFSQMNDADLNILIGLPQGEFRDNLDKTAVGLNGSVAFAIPSSPMQLGLEFGFMTYGRDTRDENFNPNVPEVRVTVATEYDIVTGHLFARYEAPSNIVKPYIDGLVGFNYLFTRTEIRDRDDRFDDIASDTNFDDFAFSYGVGGGLKFIVHRTEKNKVFINLKGRYLLGAEAAYLQPGSIEVEDGELFFDESESKTNLLTLHLGAGVKF